MVRVRMVGVVRQDRVRDASEEIKERRDVEGKIKKIK